MDLIDCVQIGLLNGERLPVAVHDLDLVSPGLPHASFDDKLLRQCVGVDSLRQLLGEPVDGALW